VLDNVLHWCAMVGGFAFFLVVLWYVGRGAHYLIHDIIYGAAEARAKEKYYGGGIFSRINGEWVKDEKPKTPKESMNEKT
jgi:hypothetical protein